MTYKENTDENYPVAKMQNGDAYTGIQQYAGMGVVKFCPKCNGHRSVGGGHIASVMGGKHWVCAAHPKPVKPKKVKK